MLTYYYALISDPCARTVDALLAYARAHPGCFLTLEPADLRAMRHAIATAWSDEEHEYVAESEEFMIVLNRRTLNSRNRNYRPRGKFRFSPTPRIPSQAPHLQSLPRAS
jgi:hypothetical protein